MDFEQIKQLMDRAENELEFFDNIDKAQYAATKAAYELMWRAQALLDAEGLTVTGDRGGVKAHPAAAILRDARSQFFAGIKALHLDTTEEPGRPGSPTAYERLRKGN